MNVTFKKPKGFFLTRRIHESEYVIDVTSVERNVFGLKYFALVFVVTTIKALQGQGTRVLP
jgi:hypothetical protein